VGRGLFPGTRVPRESLPSASRAIPERLERLIKEDEMSGKRYGFVVGGAIAGRLFFSQDAAAQAAPGPSRVVTAEEFQMVDEKGTVRAALSMSMGGPGLILFDKGGKFRAVLSLATGEDSPVLSLGDGEGNHRATLALRVNGEPYLALLDKGGKVRISLTVDKEKGPRIALLDSNEQTRAALGSVDLTKVTGTGAIETQQPVSLVLFDKDEKPIWKAP
jgi:hypothetical protein